MKTSHSQGDIKLIYEGFITRIIIHLTSDYLAWIMSLATLRVMLSPCRSFIDSTYNTSGPGPAIAWLRPVTKLSQQGSNHLLPFMTNKESKYFLRKWLITGVTFRENTVINLSATVCMREIITTVAKLTFIGAVLQFPVLNLQAIAEFLLRLNSSPPHLSVSLGNK